MRKFVCGVMVGLALSGSAVLAAILYDQQGNVAAPRGSAQSFDYFRNRGMQLDVQALRREADRQRLDSRQRPCRD